MTTLTPVDARRLRWRAQLLGGSDLAPADVVRRAVALQGQDLGAVLRAIALRSRPGTTLADVRAAFDAGLLVRAWPMRGTLFATTPEHLAALLALTADRIHRATTRRRGELGLDDGVLARARDVLDEALADRPLPRAQVLQRWEEAGIATAAGRGYHLIMHLAVGGLVHWGAFADGGAEQLLTRTTTPAPADPDAALATVVRGYVTARGPVTEADLTWWTKLPRGALRRGLDQADLTEVDVAGTRAWVDGDPVRAGASGVTLVPAFDEWVLGYADRSLVATPAMLEAMVPGGNGVFRPAVLVDGVVVGTWRPRRHEVQLVERVPAAVRRSVVRAVDAWPHD